MKHSMPHLARRLLGSGPDGQIGRLATSSSIVLMLSVASGLLGVVSQMVLTRSLGPIEYGRYAVAIGWCLALAAPAMAGLDASILRFAPRYAANHEGAQLRRFAGFSALIQVAAIAIFTIAILITPLGSAALNGLDAGATLWLILFLGSSAFLGSFSSFFVAFQHFTYSQLYQNFVRPVLLVGMVVFLALVAGHRLDAETALMVTALASMAALALLLTHLVWTLSRFGHSGEASIQARSWMTFSGWAQFGSIGQQAVVQLPIILLGAFSTPVEAGHYAVAARLSMLVTLGLSAVGAASAPMISQACGREDWEEVADLARGAARIATAVSILALILFAIGGRLILSLFGEGFVEAYLPLTVLLLGGCITALTGVNVILLSMTDQPRFAAVSIVAGAGANLVAGYLLIPSQGALGASIGMVIGATLSNLLMSLRLWSSHGLDSSVLGIRKRSPDGR